MIFVPLSTTTMAGLKNEELGNASGLYNLMRNVGGSIGISVVNTILARHEQIRRNQMLHSLTPANPNFQSKLDTLQQYLAKAGASADVAAARAFALLNGTLDRQALLWSYIDDFRYLAVLCLGCIPIVFVLKKVVGKRGAVGAGH